MSQCKSCEAEIKWLKTKTGKNMPVNYESLDSKDDDIYDESLGHISHFSTCPNSKEHRKPKEKP